MKAKDRIKYASILSKIAKQKLSELTDEEYEWLTSNRDLIVGIKTLLQMLFLKHDVNHRIKRLNSFNYIVRNLILNAAL